MNYNIDLSIIIVNWRAKELLRHCLNSIYEKTRGITLEIIVVDNASSDGSVDMVSKEFPQVRLLVNSENMGFARANNLAVPLTSGKYIGLLNPDTILLNNAFGMMVAKLDGESKIGIIGPKLLALNNTVQKFCARRFLTLRGEILWLLFGERLSASSGYYLPPTNYDTSQTVDCISGACLVVRRDALDEGQIFDPQFFMYAEDIDLCYEMARNGWKVFYLSDAQVLHYGGASASQDAIFVGVYALKANHRFFIKRYGKLTGWLYRCVCFFIILMKLIITWLILLNPKTGGNPTWQRRRLIYPQLLHGVLFIND